MLDQETVATIQKRFPQLEPALLQEIAQAGVLKQLQPEEEALRTGQFLKSNVLVLDGLVKVYREDEEGGELLMYYLESGSACALSMMCAARNEQSQVLAKAVTPAQVLMIPAPVSEAWLAKYPSWHNFIIASYRARFDELLQTLDSIVFKSLDARLVFYLKRHQKVMGPEVRLSHQQIAEELNSSREVISRLLKKLEQTGAVVLHRNFIELKNLDLF
ncbi:Crp/Fnr family transcriptional regulator [Rufibacter sp. DG15C]|uniref:Crp/Fnr family transcriptional regulator n=1 Tax=Rufibacter sp. DG15C TaxID=1379909 RepID=UPI00078D1915|nr:Crp/Fnr family transcriptional regulator [Rufibacter sp. DG15C]AMM49913.1 Crp/Fnr family transcriptional regulator [Rufibacter sp. DG15C]